MMTFQSSMNDIPIVFENEDVVVINKPAGISAHGDGTSTEDTVTSWFIEKYPESKGVGEPRLGKEGKEIERSGIVHRLDRDTSGVMILAKTQEAFDMLKAQFKNREVKKEYRALTYNHMRDLWGTINRPIGRSTQDFRLRSAQRGAKGMLREAVTHWECIGNGEYEGEPFSYVKLKPQTGRMHQLRVHLKAIDRPIICDPLYAGKKVESSNNLGLKRLALHAHALELTLPDESTERFVAPLPQEMIEAADLITQS